MGSAALLLLLIHYVFAVIGVQLYSGTQYGGYGTDGYDYFGDLGRAFYTLFQIMTLESWSHGIVRPIMEVHPSSWVYFTLFVVISAFAALNLFIGILVNAMDSAKDEQESQMSAEEVADPAQLAILEELHAIRSELAELKRLPARHQPIRRPKRRFFRGPANPALPSLPRRRSAPSRPTTPMRA